MSKFVREKAYEVQCGEEKVRLVLRPLTVAQMLRIQSVDTADDTALAVLMTEMIREAFIRGEFPTAADGTLVTIEDFTTAAVFLQAASEIGAQWVSDGFVQGK